MGSKLRPHSYKILKILNYNNFSLTKWNLPLLFLMILIISSLEIQKCHAENSPKPNSTKLPLATSSSKQIENTRQDSYENNNYNIDIDNELFSEELQDVVENVEIQNDNIVDDVDKENEFVDTKTSTSSNWLMNGLKRVRRQINQILGINNDESKSQGIPSNSKKKKTKLNSEKIKKHKRNGYNNNRHKTVTTLAPNSITIKHNVIFSTTEGLRPKRNHIDDMDIDGSGDEPIRSYRISFIVQEFWQPKYNDRNSPEFKSLAKHIEDALYEESKEEDSKLIQNVQVMEISQTEDSFKLYVTVDAQIVGDDQRIDEFKNDLKLGVTNNFQIGSLSVDDSHFTFEELPETNEIPGPEIPLRKFKSIEKNEFVNLVECSEVEFACSDKEKCLQQDQVCDGYEDCADASDEENCESKEYDSSTSFTITAGTPSGDGELPTMEKISPTSGSYSPKYHYNSLESNRCDEIFTCSVSGVQICDIQRCDGTPNCPNGEDEQNCYVCKEDQFSCDYDRCIPNKAICDNIYDCDDHSDEMNCPEKKCPEDQYQCQSGTCISRTLLCNNIPDCPNSDDEYNCRTQCINDEYQCKEESRCISDDQICDGEKDCSLGDDEEDCESVIPKLRYYCPEGKFTCRDLSCVSIIGRCDGKVDCPNDRSDEEGCNCLYDKWQCDDGTCISIDLKCNGNIDCPNDISDERNCEGNICSKDEYQCDNGQCLHKRKFCDEIYDCADYSDEKDCGHENIINFGDCNENQFMCKNGFCLRKTLRCDGTFQCNDKSDEYDCPETSNSKPQRSSPICSRNEYQCNDGSCIPLLSICDGRPDCSKNEDELQDVCRCELPKFKCLRGGGCINMTLRCNKKINCYDGSDEEDCDHQSHHNNTRFPYNQCSDNQFQCDDGICIASYKRCNNIQDCADESDEKDCKPNFYGYDENDDEDEDDDEDLEDTDDDTFDSDDGNRCRNNEFECYDYSCIPEQLICDGHKDCSNGEDEAKCAITASQHFCQQGQFECNNHECISENLACNGIFDCLDESDEANCTHCQVDRFHCRSGECILEKYHCDGRSDCKDGSDEYGCVRCRPSEFECSDGTCLSQEERCDGRPQCYDGSDELGCDYGLHGTCGHNQWQCDNLQCINRAFLCDGHQDCYDGSDEKERHCTIKHDHRGLTEEDCSYDEFFCDDSCHPRYQLCSGHPDCLDRKDEENCSHIYPSTTTPSYYSNRCPEYTCPSGKCFRRSEKCDSIPDCEDGFDEKDCPCKHYEFSCYDQRLCINVTLRCDGFYDCKDFSDEQNCFGCRSDQFKCNDNTCVERSVECDGRPDCPDGSDESNCVNTGTPSRCQYYQWQCSNGQCINAYARCDGRTDCADATDEYGCPAAPCGPESFRCENGPCIPNELRCNGRVDCPYDKSDELDCRPSNEITSRPPSDPQLNLKTYPSSQIIKESREVVFRCRDEGPTRAKVKWSRPGGRPLPHGFTDKNGRLEIPNIRVEDSGEYVCEAVGYPSFTPGQRVTVHLTVEKYNPLLEIPTQACGYNEATCMNGECISKSSICDGIPHCSDGSDEHSCSYGRKCNPNQFNCRNGKCVDRTWRCDGENDCGDNSDEESCDPAPSSSPCRYDEFQCKSGHCIPKTFHCDRTNDCVDGSDEHGCMPPVVIQPPPPRVTLSVGGSLNITCRATGVPVPLIVWRRNWGHVPDKCSSSTSGGFGSLYCPDMQQEDSGAYSCEVINVVGTIFVVPDTIVIIEGGRGPCPAGYFNSEAVRTEECVNCFCFGVTNNCKSADLFVYHLPPPITSRKVVLVHIPQYGNLTVNDYSSNDLVNLGHGIQFRASNVPYSPQEAPYLELPPDYQGNQLKSYGGSLKYEAQYIGRGRQISVPDVILMGNGFTLIHRHQQELEPNVRNPIKAQFVPGPWVKQDGRPATREEIMMTLANIERILIRLEYIDATERQVEITHIIMDSAATDDRGLGSANLVEQCACPPGYSGFSCESCAPGYQRQTGAPWLGRCLPEQNVCPPGTYGDPSRNIECRKCPCPLTNPENNFARECTLGPNNEPICNCQPGYKGRRCELCDQGYEGNPMIPGSSCRPISIQRCNPSGTEVIGPDGSCKCKISVVGRYCDMCAPNSFHLNDFSPTGCIDCFCMGVTRQCTSSSWYRDLIQTAFTGSRAPHGFRVISDYEHLVESNVPISENYNEIRLEARSDDDVLYWSLPQKFLGDKVTSYGGSLNYTISYNPLPGGLMSRNVAPDVVIKSANNLITLHYRKSPVLPSTTQTYSIPITENAWQRPDGNPVNREHLLMALADVEHIFIKATYTTVTKDSSLSYVSLDTATQSNIGTRRAVEVEQCSCPQGYLGLSCQDCAPGYKRSEEEGLYLGLCEPCECNGHSSECDAETGQCYNCGDNTQGENCELCAPGYEGDATLGSPFACQPIGTGVQICAYCNQNGTLHCENNQCICKANVIESTCSKCRPGTFNLDATNPDGCSQCFCSGVTSSCTSGQYSRIEIPVDFFTDDFTLNNYDGNILIDTDIEKSIEDSQFSYNRPLYTTHFWSLPPRFLGNQVKSYGGNLQFTLQTNGYGSFKPDQDIIILGNNEKLIWTRPRHMENEETIVVKLDEKDGWLLSDGRLASRRDILKALSNVNHILIRANPLGADAPFSKIKDIVLETAVNFGGQRRTTDIEECYCPPEYRGSSCEDCAPFHYRNVSQRVGDFGACIRCPCNEGYTDSCSMGYSGRVECHCKDGYGGERCDITVTERPIIPTIPPPGPVSIHVTISSPEILIMDVGQSVTIECTGEVIATKQPITVFWYRLNNKLPNTAVWDNGRLYLSNLQVHDSGVYVCQAQKGDELVEKKVTIEVEHGGGTSKPTNPSPPKVIINPQYIEIDEYRSGEAHCDVTGYPVPYITWSRADGVSLSPNIRTDQGWIRFASAQQSDEGQYRCTAQNDFGVDYGTLEVYIRPSTELTSTQYPPEGLIHIDPPEYNGYEGDVVRLTCSITSRDRIVYKWLKDSTEVYPSRNLEIRDNVLLISNANPSDSGYYTCDAFSPSSRTSYSTSSLVTIESRRPGGQVPPRIRPLESQYKVVQGREFSVECEATGNPQPVIRWTKVHEPMGPNVQQTGGLLRIMSADNSNRGVYSCIAESPAGTDAIDIYIDVEPRHPPEIEIYPQKPTFIRVGETVTVHCYEISGIPKSTITWNRSDKLPFSQRVQIDNEVLTINNVQIEDAGEYECHAENPAGHVSATHAIHISEPPRITIHPSGDTIEVTEGEDLRVRCDAVGNPSPTIRWQNRSPVTKYAPQSGFIDLSLPSEAILDILHIDIADSGYYTCIATNDAGSDTKHVYVKVKPRRGDIGVSEIDYPTNKYTADIGDNSTLSCRVEGVPKNQTIWTRADGQPLPRGSYFHDNDLIIPVISEEAVGVYQCMLYKDGQYKTLITAELTLIPLPRITFEPQMPISVRPNDNVEILCKVTGEEPIQMEWYGANHRSFPPSVRIDGPYLRFYSITPNDAGRYFCVASNRHGNVTKVAEVLVSPDRISAPSTGSTHEAVEGDGVALDCSIPNINPANLQFVWKRYDGQISPSAYYENSRLVIPQVQAYDQGRYVCQVLQQNGVVSENYVDLIVKRYEPVFIKPVAKQIRKKPTRSCKANDFKCISHPHTCILPSRVCDGIYDCTDHSDELNCAPSSSFSRYKRWKKDRMTMILSDGRNRETHESILKTEPQRSYLSVGDSIEVDCYSPNGENVSVIWTRADGRPLPKNIWQYGNRLHIRDAQISDSGDYICQSSTDGFRPTSYELDIQEESREKKPRVEHVEVGKSITLACDENQEASTFKWSRPFGQIQSGRILNQAELSLNNVQARDAGTYICTASQNGEIEETPIILVVTGAIPHFPQAPSSHILFPPLHNPDASKFSMEIIFKPEKEDGLLLYIGGKEPTANYFSLSLNKGHPEVRYGIAGVQRVVLSEQPISMGDWHTAKIYRNRRDALMYVDDQFPVAFPDDSTLFKKAQEFSGNLYVGGYPRFEDLPNGAVAHKSGFVGCISYLVIQDKIIEMNADSIHKEGVTSCEPCADEPCKNNGVCLESQTEMGYTCTCQRGFTGQNCTVRGNSCTPGVCGTGRCENIDSGFKCYCPLNKTGDRCQLVEHLEESSLSFRDGSYAAYKTPKNAKINITFSIRPHSLEDSIVMYIAESKLVNGDYIAVAIKDKHIELIVNYGGRIQPHIIRSRSPIDNMEWTDIHIARKAGESILRVGKESEVRGKPPGTARFLNLKTYLYIGGYDKKIHIHESLNITKGFDGCISNLRVNYEHYNLIAGILDAANVENCVDNNFVAPPALISTTPPTDPCIAEPCRNGGTCVLEPNGHFQCHCLLYWTGPICENNIQISTSAHFSDNSYIELQNSTLTNLADTDNSFVVIVFSTKNPNGLLLWQGQEQNKPLHDEDFISIGLIQGQVEFAFRLDGHNVTLKTNEPPNTFYNGKPHIIIAKRFRFEATLEIDKKVIYENNEFPESRNSLNLPGPLYLGGAPQISQLTGRKYFKGFNGCIHILENEDGAINLRQRAITGVNVQQCSRDELNTEPPVQN